MATFTYEETCSNCGSTDAKGGTGGGKTWTDCLDCGFWKMLVDKLNCTPRKRAYEGTENHCEYTISKRGFYSSADLAELRETYGYEN